MLARQIEDVSLDEYSRRMRDEGAQVTSITPAESGARAAVPGSAGGIWAALNYVDARAGIRFMIDVLGFTADLIVPDLDAVEIQHSQLRWPEGGVVQAASARRDGSVFADRPTGAESLYVIAADPNAVYDRCVAAGAEIALEPVSPDYDPDGMVFTTRDPEGNLWSFGTYSG